MSRETKHGDRGRPSSLVLQNLFEVSAMVLLRDRSLRCRTHGDGELRRVSGSVGAGRRLGFPERATGDSMRRQQVRQRAYRGNVQTLAG